MKSTAISSPRARSEKLASRLAHILAQLHQGDVLDKHHLAESFGVDVRTIERDLGERMAGIVERGANGQWQLTHIARGTIPARKLNDYAQLAGTQGLFPDSSLAYVLDQIETGPAHTGLHVQPVATEDLRPQMRLFSQLQAAVKARHECRFVYIDKPRHVQPYKLLHKNGIWYLAAAEADTNILKNFAVGRIDDLEVDATSRFTPDSAHLDYIDNQQDIWFTTQSTEVQLRVAAQAAHYFARRALLPHQQHRPHPDGDGSLLVTARIHHPQQLLPLVRYWLPHVRILQPQSLHDELMANLWDAIDACAPAIEATTLPPEDEAFAPDTQP